VQFDIGRNHIGAQPRSAFTDAIIYCGAITYDSLEILVDSDLVALLAYQLLHRVTDMYLIREDNKAV
jgi:hypothetical protein